MIYGLPALRKLAPASMSELTSNRAIEARTCLVLGGARSGKSSYAQALAEAASHNRTYLATATVWDEEMRERVLQHRRERREGWSTLEEPLALPETLLRTARPGSIVLVDCLTLWLSNLMLADRDPDDATACLADAISKLSGPAILVSNEVGSGIVPDNALARRFRDAQGRLNQTAARVCDAVVLVTAGLPSLLKPSPRWEIRLTS